MLTPEERDDLPASWQTCGGGPAMWRTGSARSSRWSSCHLLKPRQVIVELVAVLDIELAIPDGVHVLTLPAIKALAEALLI